MRPVSAPGPQHPPWPHWDLGQFLGPPYCWGLGEGPRSSAGVGWLGSKVPFLQSPVGGCLLQRINLAQRCAFETNLPTFPTLLHFGLCPGAVLESSGLGARQLDSIQMKPNQMRSRNAPHAPQPLMGVQATASAQSLSRVKKPKPL